MRASIFFFVIICFCCGDVSAWGTKEHIQLTRLAVERLLADSSTPEAMKAWLTQMTPGLLDMAGEKNYFLTQRMGATPRGADGLLFWAVMPDTAIMLDRDEKIEPFGVGERLLHYVDLEFFIKDESKRVYAHDLSGKPKLEDIPRDMKDPRWARAGMLPFRVKECYDKLVASLRAKRMTDTPGQYPRDDHAQKWAGYLSHYLEDNTQPQHASVDFQSASYFANKRGAPKVHPQVEYTMCDDENNDYMKLREEYWPLLEKSLSDVQDPVKTDDLFQATLEVAITSYDALPMIGVAAMKAAKQGGTPEKPVGPASVFDTEVFFREKGKYLDREMSVMEMKAHQQAWAVKRVERVLRKAWDESQR